jgi:hypothetical protein
LPNESQINATGKHLPAGGVCILPELKMSNAAMKLNETSSDAYEKEALLSPDVIKLKHYG